MVLPREALLARCDTTLRDSYDHRPPCHVPSFYVLRGDSYGVNLRISNRPRGTIDPPTAPRLSAGRKPLPHG